jgi:hypothetical protein
MQTEHHTKHHGVHPMGTTDQYGGAPRVRHGNTKRYKCIGVTQHEGSRPLLMKRRRD